MPALYSACRMSLSTNTAGLALELLGALLLTTTFWRFVFRSRTYVQDYDKFWQEYIANRQDFEEEALRFHAGTILFVRSDDVVQRIKEKEFARAKLRTLDWLVYHRLNEDARITVLTVLGMFFLMLGFALQLYATWRAPTASLSLVITGLAVDMVGAGFIFVCDVGEASRVLSRRLWVADPASYARHQDHIAEREEFLREPSPLGVETWEALRTIDELGAMYEPQPTSSAADVEALDLQIAQTERRVIRQLDDIASSEYKQGQRVGFGLFVMTGGFALQIIGNWQLLAAA